MNREKGPKAFFGGIPGNRRDKLAALKKAITEGVYEVKAAEIAEKFLKERLFELVFTANNNTYQNSRNN